MRGSKKREHASGSSSITMDAHSDWEDLSSAVSEFPMVRRDLRDHFLHRVFPRLNMKEWIEHILSHVDRGSAVTFGGIARALGDLRASRVVGEVIASGALRGPVHRVVYSDLRIPPPSIEVLSSEIETVLAGDEAWIARDPALVSQGTSCQPLKCLREMQDLTRPMVSRETGGRIDTLAGIDISSRGGVHALAVTRHDPDGKLSDSLCLSGDLGLPYISGYLFYREAPLILQGLSKGEDSGLLDEGTVLVMDGNGSLHPRMMGIATQVGVISDRRTIGVTKRLLTGSVEEDMAKDSRFRMASVVSEGRTIGASLSVSSTKPIYVSPGHGIDLEMAVETVLRATQTRIPEPIRWAHNLANEFRKNVENG
ncbi:MAG: endonuclease V [Thermoplasmatota archaeon]